VRFINEDTIHVLFAALDEDGDETIDKEEFLKICKYLNYQFQIADGITAMERFFPKVFNSERFQNFRDFVADDYRTFGQIIYVVITLNAIVVVIEAMDKSGLKGQESQTQLTCQYIEFGFSMIYVVEMLLKLLFNGWGKYWHNYRNRYDFVITWVLFVVSIIWIVNPHSLTTQKLFRYLLIGRVLKLTVLFTWYPRFRNLCHTFSLLIPATGTLLGLMFIAVQWNAAFMVQVWGGKINEYNPVLRNDTSYPTTADDDYYLNNANDMLCASITLFELLVVNNWFLIAEGFSDVSDVPLWLSRLFFIQFHIVTQMVILSVITTYIVEAYGHTQSTEAHGGSGVLSPEEVRALEERLNTMHMPTPKADQHIQSPLSPIVNNTFRTTSGMERSQTEVKRRVQIIAKVEDIAQSFAW